MKILWFSIFWLLTISSLFGQSLEETVKWALDNNNQIKASQNETAAIKSEWQAQQKDQLPSLSMDASYRHVTDVANINFPATPISPARDISLGVHDTYDSGLNLKYVVFSGFAETEAAKVKEFEYRIKQTGQKQTEKDVAYNTIEAYRNAQFFRLNLKTLQDALKRNELQLNRAKALLKNGMALSLDTLSLSLARMNIRQQIIRNESILDNWLQLLETLSGRNVSPQDFENDNVPVYAEFNLDAQHSFQSLQFSRQMLGALEQVKKSALYPKVFVGASLKYGKPGVDFIKNEWMAYGVWNIGLSWDIWNWGADKARIEAVKLQQSSVQFKEQALKDQLDLKYKRAERDFKSLQEQYHVAQKSVKVAREKMRIIEANAQKGQISATDFNEANLELSQAELNQQKNLIMLNLKASEIDYLSGQPISNWRLN